MSRKEGANPEPVGSPTPAFSAVLRRSFAIILILALPALLGGRCLKPPRISIDPSPELPSTFNPELTVTGTILTRAEAPPANDHAFKRLPKKFPRIIGRKVERQSSSVQGPEPAKALKRPKAKPPKEPKGRKDRPDKPDRPDIHDKPRHRGWMDRELPLLRAVIIVNGVEHPLEVARDGTFTATVPLNTQGPGASIENEIVIEAETWGGVSRLENKVYYLRGYVPHQAIVLFDGPADEANVQSVLSGVGAVVLRRIGRGKLYLIELPEAVSVEDAVAFLNDEPLVAAAAPDLVGAYDQTYPNDPELSEQWAPEQIGLPGAWDFTTGDPGVVVGIIDSGIYFAHPDLMNNIYLNEAECCLTPPCASGCWPDLPASDPDSCPSSDLNGDGCPGACGVDDDGDGGMDLADPQVTRIFHNGKDDDHDGLVDEPGPGGVPCESLPADTDLSAAPPDQDCDGAARDDDENGYLDDCRGFDFYRWDNDPTDDLGYTDYGTFRSPHSHGTHVSGIVGAAGNNGEGVSGVNWNVRIMPIKIGDFSTGYDLAAAFEALSYAGDNGCDVTNNSWHTDGVSESQANLYMEATHTDHVLNVMAAGNEGLDLDGQVDYYFPQSSSLPNGLLVANTDTNDELAGSTTTGQSNYGRSSVAVAAPGTDIYSTIAPMEDWADPGLDHWYFDLSGTSMASAQVSGLAALVLARYPEMKGDPEWIRLQIEARVDPVAALEDAIRSGGRINACNSLGGCDFLGEPPVPRPHVDEFPGRPHISAGWLHTCAITETQGVKCWGRNLGGALGNGVDGVHGVDDQVLPVDVLDLNDPTGLLTNAVSISSGSNTNCALIAGGGVKCWGLNDYGEVGDGTTINRPTAVDVIGLAGPAKALSLGSQYSCVLLEDGGVQCWGANGARQLGRGTMGGTYPTPDYVTGLTSGVASISASGGAAACAITDEGAALCWGAPYPWSQVPVQVPGLESGVKSIVVGDECKCALLDSNSVLCWGSGQYGRPGRDNTNPTEVSGLPGDTIVSLIMGGNHACVLTVRGQVYCWGGNQNGQLGIGSFGGEFQTPQRVVRSITDLINPLEDVVEITAGTGGLDTGHTCASTNTCQMKCWGMNHLSTAGGELGDGTKTDRPAPVDVDICVYTPEPAPPGDLSASPPGGAYCPLGVTLSASRGNIYYTLDGSEPTTASVLYTGPIAINESAVLKFMAADTDGSQSGVATEVYTIDSASEIWITSPADGTLLDSSLYTVSGMASPDISTVLVTSNQGHSVEVPVVGGNWSADLGGVAPPKLVVSAQGVDGCGNPGCDSVSLFETDPCLGNPTGGLVNLPADDGCHLGDGIEWWYYTGHLQTDDGRWFGFEHVFFTTKVWFLFTVVDVMMAHSAITDIQTGEFHYYEDYSLFMAPQCVANGFNLVYHEQSAVGGNGSDVIHGEVDDYVLDLQLQAVKKPVLQYGNGHQSYGGMSSYYYSRERMDAMGTLAIGGTTLPVTGWVWFDHQYEVGGSSGGNVDWDWFALQLDDYREIMIPLVSDGGVQYPAVGTSYTDRNCITTQLNPDDVTVTPSGTWHSPHTGTTYPMGWDISIRNVPHGECLQDLNLTLTPVMLDQEVMTSLPQVPDYWEGAAIISGDAQGRAYVEMQR